MTHKKILPLLFLLLFLLTAQCQQADSSYILYTQKYADIQGTRGVPTEEISNNIKKYQSNKILSNQDFADLLARYYKTRRNIAILLYFFDHDHLRRILFEPGVVKSDDSVPITKEALDNVSSDLNRSLNLYSLTADRSPRPRGIVLPADKSTPKKIDSVVAQLSSILIPPAFNKSYKHLVVIPCLNIGTIPFHLLKPYQDSTTLIDRCSFTVAPTLIDFVFQHTKAELNSRNYLSNIYYDSISFSFDRPLFISNPEYPKNADYEFPDLPGAVREINAALAHSYKGYKLFEGKEACKDSILKYMNGADVVYFATHGISDSKNPMTNSYLVLSCNSPFLTSKEIQNLRLKENYQAPELVILSACQTGLGKSMDGGIAGSIARSFIISGSDYIVESLWSVDDDATAYLMSRFIYYVTERRTEYFPAGALRLAILDTRKKYSSPKYWAGFSAFGATW